MLDLTVVILTKNEILHIERVIKNVVQFAKRIVVVDSFSTDSTVEIAQLNGAEVYQNKFINYAKQFQWALDNCCIDTDWVMRLDADELIENDLIDEMKKTIPTLSSQTVGINIARKHVFWNRWIKHGGRYPLVLLRIWRRGHGRIEDRWMDEHIVVWGGRTIALKGGFVDHNLNDLTFFTDKHNKYATREALDVLIHKYELTARDLALSSKTASAQASVKRFIKEHVYNKIPFTISASGYFFYRYILQFGFLDGLPGFVYHFLQGYWYRFLVGAKISELECSINALKSKEEIILRLESLTGHRIR